MLDFGDMRPWHYFTLPSAALTIPLFLGLDSIRKEEKAGDSIRKEEKAGAGIDALGWKIGTAIFANRVRNLLVGIWLVLALYYFADYAYGRCQLPDWMASGLEWLFGSLTCPASGN